MDLENTSAEAGESSFDELMGSLREDAAELVGESASSATNAETAPAAPSVAVEAPAEVVDDTQDAEARRTALLREIAINPAATQQYAQQQYQQQYQPQQQQVDQGPILPFDEFSYDPNNADHQRALIAAQLQEVGGPLFDKLNAITQRFEAEEEAKQVEQFKEVASQANNKTVEFLDTYVPGFGNIAGKLGKNEPLTAVERAVFNEAVNAESALFEMYEAQGYTDVRWNVQARAHIAQQIGPALQQYAKDLGLVAQPSKPKLTPEQQKVMKQEMYVESSNAVPANASSFDSAHAKGDIDGMIGALRNHR